MLKTRRWYTGGAYLLTETTSGPPGWAARLDPCGRLPDARVRAVLLDLVDAERGRSAHVAGALELAVVLAQERHREAEQRDCLAERRLRETLADGSPRRLAVARLARCLDRVRVDHDRRVGREAERLRIAAVRTLERLQRRAARVDGEAGHVAAGALEGARVVGAVGSHDDLLLPV